MSKSLIIDPGHGGTDPGASGFGVREKDWVLKMSIYQYNRLKELGAKVAITRTTDKTLDSVPRTNLIKSKYDYCMSNHFNAFNGSVRGVETIYSIYAKNDVAKRLADVIVATSKLPLRRVFNRAGTNGDYYFMHRLTGSTDTVIVEYGFIDNKADHDYFKNEDNFYKVAEAVVKEWCSILGVKYVAKGGSTSSVKPSAPKPSKPTETTSDTYKVVTNIDGYKTAVDAKGRKNKRSKVSPGTYHVFNKSKGMINITSKKGVPGSWINPADNKVANKPKPFLIRTKPSSLYYYNKADWNAKVGTVKKGTVLTVVDTLTVNGSEMYKLKSGTYITANPQYVEKV